MPAERVLRPCALTAKAFAPFGDVIDATSAKESYEVNRGYAVRFNDLARVDVAGGRVGVSLFRAKPLPAPIRLGMMERHPLGTQAFVPLGGSPFVIVVAPPGDFDAARIEAFTAAPGQGVSYGRGVWHHFLITLVPQDFLVVDRLGPEPNCDEVAVEPTWTLAI